MMQSRDVRLQGDKATVDFETRSACSLKNCGAWKYSLDPSTEVLCLAYRLPVMPVGAVALWHPSFMSLGIEEGGDVASLLELFAWIDGGGLLEAHNAAFEQAIWTNILAPCYGFPLVPPASWRCSAAKAAAHALPRKLAEAGAALHVAVLKDDAGHKLMLKLSKPRKPRKKEREAWAARYGLSSIHPRVYFEDSSLFQQLWDYCRQDVLAEEALSARLDDLNPQETQYYLLDQRMNQRGFQLDLEAVETALSLITAETTTLNAELTTLTHGAVTRATQRERLKDWLGTEGVILDDTQGTTIDSCLAADASSIYSQGELSVAARRALEILRTLGRSSTAKYETMRDWACPDGRVRGGLLYHGATTGRWTGSGVQPHNFPKGTIKGFDMEAAWDLIKSGDITAIASTYPSVMEALACALRGAIIAKKGKQLYVADYASIEARVLLWLAKDDTGLTLFRTGQDIYCDMAASIYDRPITKADTAERSMGKVAILGLGYQMGGSKFQETCATFGITIDEEFATQVVTAYREKYWRVKQLWTDVEDAALRAMSSKGATIPCGAVQWLREGTFLYCILPSGRRLAYPFPEVRERQTPWGATKMALTYKSVNAYSRQWTRETTYGGKLVENIVQAIARDILAAALQRCEESGVYVPVLSVHDEILAEAIQGTGSVLEFEQLLTTLPRWACGLPIAAEGWQGRRYHK